MPAGDPTTWKLWADGALAGAYALVALQHAQLAWRRPEVPGHPWLVAACLGALTINVTGNLDPGAHPPVLVANVTGLSVTVAALLGFVLAMSGRSTRPLAALWPLQVTALVAGFTLDIQALFAAGMAWIALTLLASAGLALWGLRGGDRADRFIALGFTALALLLAADLIAIQTLHLRWTGAAVVAFFVLFTCLSVATSERFTQVHDELDGLRRDLEARVRHRTAVIDRANRVFQRYLPPALVTRILGDGEEPPGPLTERLVVTLLFADLQGFTAWSEGRDPQRVTEVINAWLEAASDEIAATNGALDKVMGDGVMAVWGAPAPLSLEDQARGAVQTGLALLRRLEQLKTSWGPDEAAFSVRIGVHQAQVAVGNIGTRDRWSWTALGSGVNLASRLEGAANPGTVLVSEVVWERLGERWVEGRAEAGPSTARPLKGISDPVPTRTLRPRPPDPHV